VLAVLVIGLTSLFFRIHWALAAGLLWVLARQLAHRTGDGRPSRVLAAVSANGHAANGHAVNGHAPAGQTPDGRADEVVEHR
jgi:hypothetical protein